MVPRDQRHGACLVPAVGAQSVVCSAISRGPPTRGASALWELTISMGDYRVQVLRGELGQVQRLGREDLEPEAGAAGPSGAGSVC